ncbi:MSMEG_1061 family FMN-dependent PPOX-type flavoprotein [Sphingomonas sp. G-3-2-10]|uniref:MSMEG_1061 family FMN-dependent PPOX-type flavoprotein n=1 Tax=Sphingomonas sp. G-3-2-10 TaxID=2728838 RepID=UPI00146CF8B6|nr:MSMEG_1061 family FMN-dependent PPOX-type flavoprotein [Sphingomonas sp. G-3-2-10]NML04702.1 pyridoxamine 5'-phosphate oxidase family protein [Sphingomonas sp. G-3-2-10]
MLEFQRIETEAGLREIYAEPSKPVRDKSFPHLDKHSRRYLELSPFFCIGSARSGELGDVSPRGGEPGFVHVLDDTHIAFPDRPGNNRLDTLVNFIHNPAVGMLFFLPGVQDMMRINGIAAITVDAGLMTRFVHDGKPPRSVIVVETREVYFHCSKALRRSDLWNPEKHVPRGGFPTLGQIAKDQAGLPIPAKLIDFALGRDARKNLY